MHHGKSHASSELDKLDSDLEGLNLKDASTTPVPAPRSAVHHGKTAAAADLGHQKIQLEEGNLKDASTGTPFHIGRFTGYQGKLGTTADPDHHKQLEHHLKDAVHSTPVPAVRSALPHAKPVAPSHDDSLNGGLKTNNGKDHSDSTVPVSPLTINLRCPTNGAAHSPNDELFDSNILQRLDFKNALSDYRGATMSPSHPGENLTMRSLRRGDFDRGYVELLSQLSVVGNVTKEVFEGRFDGMARCLNTYFTIVLEDTAVKKIVGSVTLVVEQKFIHTAALRGRVEDVVTHRDRRGQNLGKLLIDTATILGRHLGCYKLSLECKDSLIAFYRQFGYQTDAGNNYMIQRFPD